MPSIYLYVSSCFSMKARCRSYICNIYRPKYIYLNIRSSTNYTMRTRSTQQSITNPNTGNNIYTVKSRNWVRSRSTNAGRRPDWLSPPSPSPLFILNLNSQILGIWSDCLYLLVFSPTITHPSSKSRFTAVFGQPWSWDLGVPFWAARDLSLDLFPPAQSRIQRRIVDF